MVLVVVAVALARRVRRKSGLAGDVDDRSGPNLPGGPDHRSADLGLTGETETVSELGSGQPKVST
jgi:hypothetical protein